MIFVHSDRLWLFAAWVLVALWTIRGAWRRRRHWAALAQRGRPPREGSVWWLATIACLILALAEPKWGRLGPPPAPGHDVVLAIDVSRSMGVEDALPTRMDVATEYAEKLVHALGTGPDNRAAVVAFAGRGELLCPLTENLGAVIDVLRRLRVGAVRPGGTDLGAAIDAAIEAMGSEGHAQGQSIVILSDGEDLANRWKPRLDRLIDRDITVYAVTIGDAEHGHPVPAGKAGAPPVSYQGKPVESRRSDVVLRDIAAQTGGVVVALGVASGDPEVLYRNQIEPSARRRERVPRAAEMAERFDLFLVTALSCLVAACWPPGRSWSWPGRLGWGWSWTVSGAFRRLRGSRGRRQVASALASGSLIIVAALILGADRSPGPQAKVAPPSPALISKAATPSDVASPRELVERGRAEYASGRLDDALAAFEAAARAAPASAIPRFDSAAVLFRLRRFEEARARYLEAAATADPALRTKIDYALGNTALCLGDVQEAIAAYDACIASRARGAGLDAIRQDAAINRAYAFQQAQSPAIPEGQGSEDASEKQGPEGRRGPRRNPAGDNATAEGNDDSSASAEGPGANPNNEPDTRDRIRRRRRSGSGAGGDASPGAATGSPEDRLDAALDNIRAAQARRLPDEPPPAAEGHDERDW